MILMSVGLVLVVAALALLLYNHWDSTKAGEAADAVVAALEEEIETPDPWVDPTQEEDSDEMATIEIDGYEYIGYLSVPSLGLDLPVMAEWDYTRLKISPCRYTGTVLTEDLVICGHNFDRHFGSLKNLVVGDAVYFTDVKGHVYSYVVAELEILQPTAVEEMKSSEYPLTLFTCTYGGRTRRTIRCQWADID